MRSLAFELTSRLELPLRGDVRWRDSRGPMPAVIVCHGFKGFKNWGFFPWIGERLAQAGFVSVCFNFSGSGVGANLYEFDELHRFAADTISAQIADLGTVLDALLGGRLGPAVVQPGQVAVLGHSRGGGIAVAHAREDSRVRAVATWAGVACARRWSEADIRAWRARGYQDFPNARTGQMMRIGTALLDDLDAHVGRFDLPRAASELRVPFLVVHGSADASVPAWEASALYGAAAPGMAEYLLIPGAGHTFGAEHPWKGPTADAERALDHTIAWLNRQWANAGSRT